MKKVILFFVVISILFISENALFASEFKCSITNLEGKTDEQLEKIAAQCELEKQEQEALLQQQKSKTVTISRDVSILGSKIKKSSTEIRQSEAKLALLRRSIRTTEKDLTELEKAAQRAEYALSGVIHKTNQLDDITMVEILLSTKSMGDFFESADTLAVLPGKMHLLLDSIRKTKSGVEEKKIDLEISKDNTEGLKLTKLEEKRKIEEYKKEKDRLLTYSKAKETEYKASIAELEQVKKAIRSKVYKTASGAPITFGEAYDIIAPYQQSTGVRTALVLAILFQESGRNNKIGGNLGSCTYNQPFDNKSGTVMKDAQKQSFIRIMEEIGRDPNTTPVSCPIPRDGSYGGAMGPSQFMPDTWMGYRKQVARILGKPFASPFVNQDAFLATALYMKRAQDRCITAFDSNYDIWRCSAAKYYAGLNSKGSSLAKHMRGYGRSVADRTTRFQRDIDTLLR